MGRVTKAAAAGKGKASAAAARGTARQVKLPLRSDNANARSPGKPKADAAARLAESEAQMAAISRVMAVIAFDLDGRVLECNENFLGTMGYTRDEVIGVHHRKFVDAEYAQSNDYRWFWAELREGKARVDTFRRVSKSGAAVWLQASYNPVIGKDGRPYKVVKFASDVTKNVENQAQAAEAKRQMEAISKVMAVISFDLTSRVLDCNDNFCRALGYSREEVIGAVHRKFVEPTYAASPEYQSFWDELRAGRAQVAVFERVGKGGRRVIIQASYNPVVDDSGRVVKVVKFATDLTDQTERAAKAERDKQELAKRALEEEALAAARAMEALGRLVTAVEVGKLRERVDTQGMPPKYQGLCDGVNRMMDGIARPLDEIAQVLDGMAQGDLRRHVDGAYQNDLQVLKDSVNGTVDQLSVMAEDMRQIAGNVAHASEEISSGTSDLSKRTEQQAASLEETASTMEEMTATVKQNAESARQANLLAMSARSVAERGGEVVAQAVRAMDEINKSSAKIADIIGVIDAIAFQTNLLALNAAVEAARAGEQGRGFAVVASEVRSLAQRSATAAKEIKALIKDSTDKVGDGSNLVRQSGATLEDIVASVKRVADIVAQITAASDEQSGAIEQVNQTISKMDEFTQQNSALVEETASAASSMSSQAGELLETVGRFQVGEAEPPPASRRPVAPARTEPKRQNTAARQAAAAPPGPARWAAAPSKQKPPAARPPDASSDEDGFSEF
jgi:methyl-accepting chemotaxis protein